MKYTFRISTGLLAVLCALILLNGCIPAVKNPSVIDHELMKTTSNSFPEYRIQPGDQLDIKFFYNQELNEQITVRPDGRISLQLVREILVAGMTPAQLNVLLIRAYAAELQNPEVTVIVRSFTAQRVYVDGEVNKPGLVSLVSPMTVLQTISQAGGLKDTARLNEVIILRRAADNNLLNMVVNLENIIDGTDTHQDIVLHPSDIVYVPKSHIANVNQWVDQYLRKNIPLPIGIGASIY